MGWLSGQNKEEVSIVPHESASSASSVSSATSSDGSSVGGEPQYTGNGASMAKWDSWKWGVLRENDAPNWKNTSPYTAGSRTSVKDEQGRDLMRMFFRVKSLRSVDHVTDSFYVRFRYFAYFNDDDLKFALVKHDAPNDREKPILEVDRKQADTVFKSRFGKFKRLVANLSAETKTELPYFTWQNHEVLDTIVGAELIVKSKVAPFDFCLTEQVEMRLQYHFDLRDFPFDCHTLVVSPWLSKSRDRKKFWMACYENDGFRDEDEMIPFYAFAAKSQTSTNLEDVNNERIHLWYSKHKMMSVEYEGMDLAQYRIHTGSQDKPLPLADNQGGRFSKPNVKFFIHISRRDEFYTTEIFFISSLLVCPAFLFFTLTLNPVGYDITLMLTSIAFKKFTPLPVLPYATMLDKHFHTLLFFLVFMMLFHAAWPEIVYHFLVPEGEKAADWYEVDHTEHGLSQLNSKPKLYNAGMHLLIFVVYLLYNLRLAMKIWWLRRRRKKKFGKHLPSAYDSRSDKDTIGFNPLGYFWN